MPVISVITPVDPATSRYLPEAYASLAAQELPSEWEWEWLVQCDSLDTDDQDLVQKHLPEDDRVRFSASRRCGPGVARNMALTRARGSLIKNFDSDDWLAAGVLYRDIEALRQRGVRWSASPVVDVYPDGTQQDHHTHPLPPGNIRNGAMWLRWKNDYTIAVHPATLCVRYRTLMAVGGWAALPAGEDTALLLALDGFADGVLHEEVGLYYRRRPEQMSAQAQHVDPEELAARREFTSRRWEAVNDMIDGVY